MKDDAESENCDFFKLHQLVSCHEFITWQYGTVDLGLGALFFPLRVCFQNKLLQDLNDEAHS
jgi:hypothetical protein